MENEWHEQHARRWWVLGQNVKKFRTAQGWTQTELAERLRALGVEMHQTTIAKLENGTRPTVVHEIWALAKVFVVPYDELLPPVRDQVPDELVKFYELRGQVAKALHEKESFERALEAASEKLQRVEAELDQVVEELRAKQAKKGRSDGVDQEEG